MSFHVCVDILLIFRNRVLEEVVFGNFVLAQSIFGELVTKIVPQNTKYLAPVKTWGANNVIADFLQLFA